MSEIGNITNTLTVALESKRKKCNRIAERFKTLAPNDVIMFIYDNLDNYPDDLKAEIRNTIVKFYRKLEKVYENKISVISNVIYRYNDTTIEELMEAQKNKAIENILDTTRLEKAVFENKDQ